MEVNPKGECKAINLRGGKILQGSNQGGLDKEVIKCNQPKSLNEAHEPTRKQPTDARNPYRYVGPLTPRHWCWRLGVARHDATSLVCCLITPRRCTGHLGVGAEILGWTRA
ncbi:hypothetical protein PIB30_088873 [Stylosanthes scabra]|uniref:Uncharacterized protein n=1 Tax=Stylosanthes scabra TaxID=79078 RepID=A0ABU6SW56_9FABA|nr:hypothetical protein [Stylosanthes scabra]